MPAKGTKINPNSKYAAGKLRPQTWTTGPDPLKHTMLHPWQVMKAQAKFRKEDFELEFEEFYNIWKDHWDKRGRYADDLCLTRKDFELEWSVDNCELLTRKEYLQRQGAFRRAKNTKYKTRKNRKAS
jgi:hypothetical protein